MLVLTHLNTHEGILASVPSRQFFSSATRSATDVAAIRLGYYCE